ncbi:enoyl-CoA hydratase/carnithine racemase [Diaminobutyricimonas aerilata]|uniref:Enoyl-CoA hydratase/carnithine racemase n=1 Tax=Diaminobutyricimonas aerilata TaxID=1162967 RepID=A0A2M9CLP0_9MICO|nr:enoyl-CoA hydratase/isomerase family protein [Diaminobutyricimonas aerilata]PJJ72816.1 enoyl-CoA hydratase/carnithine racemase [Diaminobutyricimonas aerilata]
MTYEQLRVTRTSPALWRVAFDAPPINLIGPQLVIELRELVHELETDPYVSVVVFESAIEDYFLAHWDIAADPRVLAALPVGPTGYSPWIDVLIRLSKVPAITVSSIRGRTRGAGSEFVLATDIRFASREKAVLGQFEVGVGAVPGGGTPSRLPRLIGRGRALEILVGADDYDGELAERYGYVNRALPDGELDDFVTAFAERVSRFDSRALQEVKAFVDSASLPPDEEFPPQIDAFRNSVGRPETQQRIGQLVARGLQQASATESELGAAVAELDIPVQPPRGRA